MIAGACLCWALDNNFTRRVSGSDALQIAMVKGLAAGATNTLLALSLGHVQASLSQCVAGGLIGFLGYGLSLIASCWPSVTSGPRGRAPTSRWHPLWAR